MGDNTFSPKYHFQRKVFPNRTSITLHGYIACHLQDKLKYMRLISRFLSVFRFVHTQRPNMPTFSTNVAYLCDLKSKKRVQIVDKHSGRTSIRPNQCQHSSILLQKPPKIPFK